MEKPATSFLINSDIKYSVHSLIWFYFLEISLIKIFLRNSSNHSLSSISSLIMTHHEPHFRALDNSEKQIRVINERVSWMSHLREMKLKKWIFESWVESDPGLEKWIRKSQKFQSLFQEKWFTVWKLMKLSSFLKSHIKLAILDFNSSFSPFDTLIFVWSN